MPKATDGHMASDDKRPFENFQEVVKNLLHVPKEEVDRAAQSHQKQVKREKPKEEN